MSRFQRALVPVARAAALLVTLVASAAWGQRLPEPSALTTKAAVAQLIAHARKTLASHGSDSDEYRGAVIELVARVQADPSERSAHKASLYMMLDAFRMVDLRGDLLLTPQLMLAKMTYEDQDYALALVHFQDAQRAIIHLRRAPDALQRWPDTQWLEEVEIGIAECLHRLERLDEAEVAYSALIDKLRRTPNAKRPVLAQAVFDMASLASQRREINLALLRIEESVNLTLAIPDVDPQTLAERLAAWMQLLAAVTKNAPRLDSVKHVLALARQADVPGRAPEKYVGLLDNAASAYVIAGQLERAREVVESAKVMNASGVAQGLQLVLALQGLEIDARLDRAPNYTADWEAIKAQALGLADDQKLIFADAARIMAWESFGPVLDNWLAEMDRGRRARAVTEFAAELALSRQPQEHPRMRLLRMQRAAWQMMLLDFDLARPELEKLMRHDAGTLEDAALRAAVLQMLAMTHTFHGHQEVAIALSKDALNAFHALPPSHAIVMDCAQSMCVDVPTIAIFGRGLAHRWLSTLLIAAGRTQEAQQLMLMLKEQELAEALRGAGASQTKAARADLTGLERSRFASFYKLRERQATLAAERLQLQSKDAAGTLDPAGRRRLREIDHINAIDLGPAIERFLAGLNEAIAQGADASVVQSGESVVAEATRIQRDVDRWARDTPYARAVGLQYVVDKETLSIVITVPQVTPIARQIPIRRTDLYEALFLAGTLLRTPDSKAQTLKPALQALHKILIAPIEGDLRKLGARTLLLSLDDQLRQMPFAALVDKDGRYLVESFALALYNEAAPDASQRNPSRNWHVAAMGMSQPVAGLSALSAVPAELEQVVKASRSGGKTFLDAQFTRESLKGAMLRHVEEPFNVLHLASHFVLHPGDASRSTLYLGDGSAMSLEEMIRRQLDFRGFELVVYSACETGVAGGRDADGMEMESLSAQTRRQGATSVLGTLWRVSDSSVALAMASFYNLSGRKAASLAANLRDAQLKMLKHDSANTNNYTHPFHWAPFVLLGNWQ